MPCEDRHWLTVDRVSTVRIHVSCGLPLGLLQPAGRPLIAAQNVRILLLQIEHHSCNLLNCIYMCRFSFEWNSERQQCRWFIFRARPTLSCVCQFRQVCILNVLYNLQNLVHSDTPKIFLYHSCQKIDSSNSIQQLGLHSLTLTVVLHQRPHSRVEITLSV